MSLTCVLVDDSPEFLNSAARLLEAEGMQVLARCATGQNAAEVVSTRSPDVILVDVELGDEDGVIVARRLLERAPSSVVILISSRDRDELCDVLGPDPEFGFIAKQSLCVATIRELVG